MNTSIDMALPYQYAPLQHPESIRILVLHPSEDHDAPIECSFLDETPILPVIQQERCRKLQQYQCSGDCVKEASSYDLPSSSGSMGNSDDGEGDDLNVLTAEYNGGIDEEDFDFEMAHSSLNHASDESEGECSDGICDEYNVVPRQDVHSMDVEEEDDEEDDDEEEDDEDEDDEEEDDDEEDDDEADDDGQTNSDSELSDSAREIFNRFHRSVKRPPQFPAYEALSYTWGDASDRLPISLGPTETSTMITRNCFEALKSLRLSVSKRLLWIDALCINQDDLTERTTQVRLMGRIFASSHQVIIYLGEETQSSRLLFEELALADRASRVYRKFYRGLLLPFIDRPKPERALIDAMDTLLERPWFNRVWVLQEAYNSELAANPNAVIICGRATASFTSLYECIGGYSRNRITQHHWPYSMSYSQSNTPTTLWGALIRSYNCQATDPRDKAFALRAMVQGNEAELDSLVNYNTGTEEAFTRVAVYLLKFETGLYMLSMVNRPSKMKIPSWVPDWTQKRYRSSLSDYFQYKDCLSPLLGSGHGSFSIQNRSCQCGNCTGSHLVLQVKGYKLSNIQHLGSPFWYKDLSDVRKQMTEVLNLVGINRKFDNQTKPMHHSLTPTLLKALQAKLMKPGYLVSIFDAGKTFENDWQLLDDDEGLDNVYSGTQSQAMFLDTRGNLGFAPEEALEADVLCFLDELANPVLLRPRTTGGWQLLSGKCYVRGMEKPSEDVDEVLSSLDLETFDIW